MEPEYMFDRFMEEVGLVFIGFCLAVAGVVELCINTQDYPMWITLLALFPLLIGVAIRMVRTDMKWERESQQATARSVTDVAYY